VDPDALPHGVAMSKLVPCGVWWERVWLADDVLAEAERRRKR